ncbi:MAG: ATP synthase F1 subunit delta [Oscillospiraceae bacterium]|jgi:F-type H+-transporting ATPase subunit delta|nr:ATP synthase F1 subunit delta [Oscillospiraceae bacterium]
MEKLSVIYASSLYDIALEHDAVDEFLEQAILVHDSLDGEECRRMLLHPQITAAEKHEFFRKVFAGKLHDDFLGFLYLITDKNRETHLFSTLEILINTIKRHNKIVKAKIISANPYDDKQAESLREMLSDKLGKQIELELSVNPSLIGGPYIFVDGYYMDWTVKKRLRDLTVNLKEGCSA